MRYELKSVNSVRNALIWDALELRDCYKMTGMKWLVWSALVCSALIWSGWFDFGMKWPRNKVTSVWSEWYKVALVWTALVWSVWYELIIFPWYDVTQKMKWRLDEVTKNLEPLKTATLHMWNHIKVLQSYVIQP